MLGIKVLIKPLSTWKELMCLKKQLNTSYIEKEPMSCAGYVVTGIRVDCYKNNWENNRCKE